MKKFVSAVVMSIAAAGANAQSGEQVWGTLIGGGLGYVFGDGSGHQKEIAAASALGGLAVGTHMTRERHRRVYSEPVYAYEYEYEVSAPSYGGACARQVPPQFARNPGARNAWIQGCADRLEQYQYELEQQAYEAGAR